ncbi:uncharacterized protein LOC111342144 [Stylophora pistillata]|uniref:uncharacterized protein LOC111342144 n=1 Tax=Stylophora pistillata TaxID=50429 RepID=UPI000C0442EA|nr:uncharacterized protein LOC111342144 [Stylophora pistillata]
MLIFTGFSLIYVLQLSANMALASDDLKIKLTITTHQPLIPGNEALLHVDCQNATVQKEAIQSMNMKFLLPYFLQFKSITSSAGYSEPSSYRNDDGQLILELGK